MALLYNLARMTTATTGTGTITLGSAAAPFLTFAQAGVTDGQVVSYAIIDGASNSEIGTGTYTSSGTTLTRTVTKSSNSDSAISLSGAAQVFISPRAEDFGKVKWLATGVASTSASVSFSSTYITSTYDKYLLLWDSWVPSSNGAVHYIQVSANNGGAWQTSSYLNSGQTSVGGTASQTSGTTGGIVAGDIAAGSSNTAARANSGWATFSPNFASAPVMFVIDAVEINAATSSSLSALRNTGMWNSAGVINAVRFIENSGNIATLNAYLYGFTKTAN